MKTRFLKLANITKSNGASVELFISGIEGVFSGMSMQDVFSDSDGNPYRMLKTSCRPISDGENAAQLAF